MTVKPEARQRLAWLTAPVPRTWRGLIGVAPYTM
jgi:hypothetical protein